MTEEEGPETAPSAYRRAVGSLDHRTVRHWALSNGIEVSRTGGIPRFVFDLYREAQVSPRPRRP